MVEAEREETWPQREVTGPAAFLLPRDFLQKTPLADQGGWRTIYGDVFLPSFTGTEHDVPSL